jgi:hypothetical protein
MLNKHGDKYYILISLILGLIVLSLSLYFIFQEYFTEDTINWESCRQSVYLRATLPEAKKGMLAVSFKNEFPLKCKTQVVEVTKVDVENDMAGKIVADTMVQCWNLFGNGDYEVFPSKTFGVNTFCVPCARVSLTEEAKEYLSTHPNVIIDIQDTLENSLYNGVRYRGYLNTVGGIQAIPNLRELGADSFKLTGFNELGGPKLYEPKLFNPGNGDLLIVYGSITSSKKDMRDVPYLFYFQIDQELDPFKEIESKEMVPVKVDVLGVLPVSVGKNLGLCENWEGIPA